MKTIRTGQCACLVIAVLALFLSACGGGGGGGDAPTRYDPGPVYAPTDLVATAGDEEVALSWAASPNADEYNVYYSTSPSVAVGSSAPITTTGTSVIVSGLQNNTTYYFLVTSVAPYEESGASGVASAQPIVTFPGLVDLNATWNFNILVSGQEAGWMQGQVTIINGVVTFDSFLDSSGNTTPPSDLFGTVSVLPDGSVSQTGSPTSFYGGLSNDANRDILVGTASWRASNLIAILQKQVSSVTFVDGDIKGFGGGPGPRYFVYNQISSGSVQEWEFAVGQIGQNAIPPIQGATISYYPVKYDAVASSNVGTSTFPGKATPNLQDPSNFTGSGDASKSSGMGVTGTGSVAEVLFSLGGVPPAAYFQGVMSADKTVIVGTFTGPMSGEYALRIYQMVDIAPSDVTNGITYTLSRPYNFQKLAVGASVFSAYGTMQPLSMSANATSGTISFSSYTDTVGGSAPADAYFTYLTTLVPINQAAILNNPAGGNGYPADLTFYGKVSYYSDLVVSTRTEPNGARSLTVGIQMP